MKITPAILIKLLLFIPLVYANAQIAIPKGYFTSPLKIGLALTGTFSEVRSNHFHSGLDIAVQQKVGLPVYAIADGVVSRIKVSPYGFGNALYIDHPNGFTSVYAHLDGYIDTLSAYIYRNQYKVKSFEVDLFPASRKEFIYVKKGQLIGYAGNSGSSGGPHLHFEIRNTKTEHIINPLLFDFPFTDKLSPYIDFINIYPDNINSYIGSSNEVKRLTLKKTGGNEYRLASNDTLSLWGDFSIGVQAFDYNQRPGNRNGFYSLKMFVDNASLFAMVCDSFSFAESRYLNASIDYEANYNLGNRIVCSKKRAGNQLSFFNSNSANGVATFNDTKIHEVLITVADVAGNSVNLKFWVKPVKPQGFVPKSAPVADPTLSFRYNKVNKYENGDLKMEIPANSLYEDLVFKYKKSPGGNSNYSDIHYLHDATVPLHSKMKVSIKATNVPKNLQSKALLMRIDRKGKRSSAGGSFENGYVTATTNLFDGYAIVVDTVAPVIKPGSGNSTSKINLKFTVSDNFSGITTYRGEVNGKWVLVEWDPKNKLMKYTFDQVAQSGKNTFKLFVEDDKGNSASYTTSFIK